MTGAKMDGLGLLRDDDSDDVRWALQTAAIQMTRGGTKDAVVWVERAADAAEDAGNDWRAAELRAHARTLTTDSGRPSMPSIPVEVEEVELDELLERPRSAPPNARASVRPLAPPPVFSGNPQQAFGGGQQALQAPPLAPPPYAMPGAAAMSTPALQAQAGSRAPAVYGNSPGPNAWVPIPNRSSAPAPRLSQPPPLPGQLVGFSPGGSLATGMLASRPPSFGFNSTMAGVGPRSPSMPPALPGELAAVARVGISPIPPAVAMRSGSLAQRTEITFPAAGRIQQPSAPSLTRDLRSSTPPPLPPNPYTPGQARGYSSMPPFSAAPSQRQEFEQAAMRPPMGSSPDLEINEVDLDEAGIDLISLGPNSVSHSSGRGWSQANGSADGVIAELEPSYGRASSAPPSQDLSHLYDEEEVLEDETTRDRVSVLTLEDLAPFTSAEALQSGPPSLRGSELPPADDAAQAAEPAWLTPKGRRISSEPPAMGQGVSSSFSPHSNTPPKLRSSMPTLGFPAIEPHPGSLPPPSRIPAESVPASARSSSGPASGGLRRSSAPPKPQRAKSNEPAAFSFDTSLVETPTAAMSVGNLSSANGPSSAPGAKSKPPVLVRKGTSSSPPPSRADSGRRDSAGHDSVRPWAPEGPTSRPTAISSAPRQSGAPRDSGISRDDAPPQSISSLPTLMPKAQNTPTAAPASATSRVDGVELAEARGFEDLPAEVQVLLASSARIETLSEGEEVAFFGAIVVTFGAVDILPAISDEAGASAHQGEVVFTIGTLSDAMPLRVVAKLPSTRVAVWDRATLNEAIAECPWVHDELHQIADRFLACCGATLGALGERLDDALRGTVYSRFDVASYGEGEILVNIGETVPKLFVVGGGKVELLDKNGQVSSELGPGDFLFPSSILSAGKAPHSARAGAGGLLVLQASRTAAHELFMSVPPLLEILAG